jgi:hypothetical protein
VGISSGGITFPEKVSRRNHFPTLIHYLWRHFTHWFTAKWYAGFVVL